MRLLIPALSLVLLCGCDKETHVRHKVYSVLPQIEEDIQEGEVERAFSPEILNPWVLALDTPQVVASLQNALDELPQYRRASLWMLKAYAPAEIWQPVAARYPDLSADLPGVAGYGGHPKTTEPGGSEIQSRAIRSDSNQPSAAVVPFPPPPVPYTLVAYQHIVPGWTNIDLTLTSLIKPEVSLLLKSQGNEVGSFTLRPSKVGTKWIYSLGCLTGDFFDAHGAESRLDVFVGSMSGTVRLRDAEVRSPDTEVAQQIVEITAKPQFELRHGASYLQVQEGTNVAEVLWSTLKNPPVVRLNSSSPYTFTFVMEEMQNLKIPRLAKVQDEQGTIYDWEKTDDSARRSVPPPIPYTLIAQQAVVPGFTNIDFTLTSLREPYVRLVLKDMDKRVGSFALGSSRFGTMWFYYLGRLTGEFFEAYGEESILTVNFGAIWGEVKLGDAEVRSTGSTDTRVQKVPSNASPDAVPPLP